MNFEEKLIDLVKTNRVLYDRNSRGYKNIKLKAEKWKEISEILNETEKVCQRRWKSLRDKFAREVKEQNKELTFGYSNNFKPEWEYFQHLNFLSDHMKPKRTLGNFSEIDASTTESIPITKKKKTDESQFHIEDVEENEKYSDVDVVKELCSTMDELKNFFKNYEPLNLQSNFSQRVDVLIKGLKPHNRVIAEKKIIKYLCICQIKDLENASLENRDV